MTGYPTMLVEHAINALLVRVGFDLLRNPVIKQKIQERIQSKINNLRVPDYIQSLTVRGMCITEYAVHACCRIWCCLCIVCRRLAAFFILIWEDVCAGAVIGYKSSSSCLCF